MPIVGRNEIVEHIRNRANYGFQSEMVGDIRFFEGEWHVNGVPINEIFSAMLKNFNGTAAFQAFVVPVETDYRVADNTLVQGDFTYRPGSGGAEGPGQRSRRVGVGRAARGARLDASAGPPARRVQLYFRGNEGPDRSAGPRRVHGRVI